jgi:hypothetical protein
LCDGAIATDDEDWCFSRTVVVLAPGDRLDAEALGRSVGLQGRQLLLVSVGYPPTPDQRTGFDAAMQLATDRGIPFEARLAWTMDEALDLVSPLDDVLQCLAMPSTKESPGPIGGASRPRQREQR